MIRMPKFIVMKYKIFLIFVHNLIYLLKYYLINIKCMLKYSNYCHWKHGNCQKLLAKLLAMI